MLLVGQSFGREKGVNEKGSGGFLKSATLKRASDLFLLKRPRKGPIEGLPDISGGEKTKKKGVAPSEVFKGALVKWGSGCLKKWGK